MTSRKYSINGKIIREETEQGIANPPIEAWDKDLIFNDIVGSAEIDELGQFQIEFTEAHFRECFLDRRADLFFKIFRNDELIYSTEDSVLWNCDRIDLARYGRKSSNYYSRST